MGEAPDRAEHRFELTGGRLCLDFVNTLGGDRDGERKERLAGYEDLLAWARQAGAIEPSAAHSLAAEARRRPADAATVMSAALGLREALYRIFAAVAARRDPADEDVGRLSSALLPAFCRRRLARAGGGWALAWDDPPDALDAPVWRVAVSAAELLTSGADLARVRVCALHDTHECSWVFMDATRAGTRRWCSMKDCGNKAKARRHYDRARRG